MDMRQAPSTPICLSVGIEEHMVQLSRILLDIRVNDLLLSNLDHSAKNANVVLEISATQ